MTRADVILTEVYQTLNIEKLTSEEKYNHINDIVMGLRKINRQSKIDIKTTGTISERLCELALKSAVDGLYNNLSREWKWIGDFSILGNPFNLIISVKSFKAKERLMSSGSGNILSPTVGWGLFDDISEWSEQRIKSYLFRAFIAIYMLKDLYNKLLQSSKDKLNINNKKFIRTIDTFITDLRTAVVYDKIDIMKF